MITSHTFPALFLDRDATIIEDRGHLRHRSQVIVLPETFDAIRRLQKKFLLFSFKNQPGIARKAITREEADNVNAYVVIQLAETGIRITDVYVYPRWAWSAAPCSRPIALSAASEPYPWDCPASSCPSSRRIYSFRCSSMD